MAKSTIRIPALNEFIFQVMRNATPVQKKNLDDTDKLIFRSPGAIRKFANEATLDKQQVMLVKLGYSFTIFIAPGAEELDEVVLLTYDQYLTEEKHANVIEATARNRVFAYGDREVQTILSMCAQNSQTKVYQFTMASKKAIESWNEYKKRSTAINTDNAQEAYVDFNKLILAAQLASAKVSQQFEIDELQMLILQILYANVNKALRGEQVLDSVSKAEKPKAVYDALDDLCYLGYASSDRPKNAPRKAPGQKIYYMISAKGIKLTKEYIESIIKKVW